MKYTKLSPKETTIATLKDMCGKTNLEGLKLVMKKENDPKEHNVVSIHEGAIDIAKCECFVEDCKKISYDHVVCRFCLNVICDDHRYFAKESTHKIHSIVCSECKKGLKEIKEEEEVRQKRISNSSFNF